MYYRDLDLAKLRNECGLDFAHYTYKKGMCPHRCGPKDLPKKYWKDGIIPHDSNFTFILFNNSDEENGTVCSDDVIGDNVHIMYRFDSDDQMKKVCKHLSAMLGYEYQVIESDGDLVIKHVNNIDEAIKELKEFNFKETNDFILKGRDFNGIKIELSRMTGLYVITYIINYEYHITTCEYINFCNVDLVKERINVLRNMGAQVDDSIHS